MKVLVIEDNREIIEAISLAFQLRWEEAAVIPAEQGRKGLEMVETESPDVVILDIGLPDMGGFEVLREIRRFSDVPVIILTVRAEELDKVKGLELGADDYVTKPFGHMELISRVKAVLRRTRLLEPVESQPPFVNGNLTIDSAAHEVRLRGEIIKLTSTEYRLLTLLAKNVGRVVTYRKLLQEVWGEDYTDEIDYLRIYVLRLRKKLEDEASQMILTESGVGYKLAKLS